MLEGFWFGVTVIGPIVLILAIGYALIARRRLSAAEKQRQASGVRDLYRGGEGGSTTPATATPPKAEKDG